MTGPASDDAEELVREVESHLAGEGAAQDLRNVLEGFVLDLDALVIRNGYITRRRRGEFAQLVAAEIRKLADAWEDAHGQQSRGDR